MPKVCGGCGQTASPALRTCKGCGHIFEKKEDRLKRESAEAKAAIALEEETEEEQNAETENDQHEEQDEEWFVGSTCKLCHKAPKKGNYGFCAEHRVRHQPRGHKKQKTAAKGASTKPLPPTARAGAALVGLSFSKKFGRKQFAGKVTSWDAAEELYHVEYSDGDEEDLDEEELTPLLPKSAPAAPAAPKPAAKSQHAQAESQRKADTKAVAATLGDLLCANRLVAADVKGFIDARLVHDAKGYAKAGMGLTAAQIQELRDGLKQLQVKGVLEGLKAAKTQQAQAGAQRETDTKAAVGTKKPAGNVRQTHSGKWEGGCVLGVSSFVGAPPSTHNRASVGCKGYRGWR